MNSYLYLGEYDKFRQSLPVNDSAYILFYRGFAEYYENNREQAADDFDRAYERDSTSLHCLLRSEPPSGIFLRASVSPW